MGKRKRPASKDDNKKKAKKSDVSDADKILVKAPFVEKPEGDDRRREAALYELLGSEDESERIKAAECIITNLLGDGADIPSVPEEVLKRHLDWRLFRGLASGRNASRLGFSLVLTELLNQLYGEKNLAEEKYPGMQFRSVLGFLIDKTQAIGNIPGQEERDHVFGQLFGLTCFVRAQILFDPITRWRTVLDLLLKLGYKKVWLRSQCGWVIAQALEQMSQEEAESTLQSVTDGGLARTPEGVALWMIALNRFPDLKVKPWKNPLSAKSLPDLTAVLKESLQNQESEQVEEDARRKNKQANWTAQLHFVWDLLLSHYQKVDTSASDFEQFWSRVVDDGLFSKSATDGQKFKGFMVFQKMLAGLADQPEKLQCLFSKNFTTCWMNQAAKEDRFLHRAATKALKALENTVSSHPSALVPVLRSLLGKNGAYNFDQRTRTKTVDHLLQNLTKDTELACLSIIQEPIAKLKSQETSIAQLTLRTYVDYLSKALNASAQSDSHIGTDAGLLSIALQELGKLAYSQPKSVPAELLTESVRQVCRSRLETSFAKLIRRSDDFAVFCKAISAIDSSSVNMDDEIRSTVEEALVRMNKLLKRKSKSESEKSLSQGLAILHAVSIFQLYNEEPDAMEVLEDLAQFSDRLKKGKLEEEGSGSSELLVEILLSMVTQPSSLMREVSQQVFEAFTAHVSAEGLELLTGPLESNESTKGQKELFNTEDDAMDVDDDDEDDSSDEREVVDVEDASDIDSDVEFVGLNGDEADDDAEEEDDDEEEEDDSDEEGEESGEDEEQQNLNELDDKLSKILNSHRLDKDADADSSDSDQDMSDSEMLAVDNQLAAALKGHVKPRSDSRKEKKDAKQSVVNFKHRILDLLDIYVKNEALSALAISILVPLLRLMRTTSTKPLANRASTIIFNYQKVLRKARSNKETPKVEAAEELLPELVGVHEEAVKDNSHAYAKAASAASLIIASSMFAVDRESIKQIDAVYGKTRAAWILGEVKVQNAFLLDYHNWGQNQASQSAA